MNNVADELPALVRSKPEILLIGLESIPVIG